MGKLRKQIRKLTMSASFGNIAPEGHNERVPDEELVQQIIKEERQKTASDGLSSLELGYRGKSYENPDIDPLRTHLNRILINEDIEDVYHELFDDALEKYNERQTRNDRKIENYFEKIKNSKQEKLSYECVIGMGNKGTNSAQDEANRFVCDDVYQQFVKQFKKEFPQFRIVQAIVHNDESTPHLHLRYVPFSTDNKRGLETKNSHAGAMRQMGWKIDKNHQAIPQLNRKFLEMMEKAAKNHGIERLDLNSHRSHMTVREFKEYVNSKDYPFRNDPEIIAKLQELDNELEIMQGAFSEMQKINEQLVDGIDCAKRTLNEAIYVHEHGYVYPVEEMKTTKDMLEEISDARRMAEKFKQLGRRFSGSAGEIREFVKSIPHRIKDHIAHPLHDDIREIVNEIQRAREDLQSGATTLQKLKAAHYEKQQKKDQYKSSAKKAAESSVDQVERYKQNERSAKHRGGYR